ncbi:MAG: glycoside hydrolase family 3 C-terminal domain-containing protein [Treponema sp.]|nr:glycoside hydrolase family 3 C-terminal domain-containing protein [Treponema sp.]
MTFSEAICQAACEGIVLLKNDGVLPFSRKDTVSVFGRCQKDFYKSGMGSGGSVHASYTTNLIDELCALEDKGLLKVNRSLKKVYENWLLDNPFDNGNDVWAAEPWSQKEMDVSPELAEDAARISDHAVFVIGRNAGEDKDLEAVEGSWYLTKTEKTVLKNICSAFEKVTVVFNTCSIIDTSFINAEEFGGKIKAVLYAWMGGMESGRAAAKILCGLECPSGKLTDTIAFDIKDYPSTKNFGGADENIYEEDIFVGYRYFNTFAKDKILYPFGFGLSYTTFSVTSGKASFDGKIVSFSVCVKNTGSVSGKETVQVYLAAPCGLLGKPARELCAFKKTELLAPGKSETLTFEVDIRSRASYDESGLTGFASSYVLEKGKYSVYAGTDSLSAECISFGDEDGFFLKENICVEKLSRACAPVKNFRRMKNNCGKLILEEVPLSDVDLKKRISENLPSEMKNLCDRSLTFDDVKKDPSLLESFIAQLSVKELCTVVRGEGMMSPKATMGIAAAYGGLSESLWKKKVPVAGCADGPSGIRIDSGGEASLLPIGTQLACTWNEALNEELFVFEGQELFKYKIDALLGPGINIHRSPLNGRNFEYFSEDPFLTGCMACCQVRGIKKGGSNATVKHFAGNNQERRRNFCDAVVSERAFREIYLKPFEMTVKERNLVSMMSSYNPINGHWAASNYDLINTILRKEWNYDGVVMTDWWAKMNDCADGGLPSEKNVASMIRARNDIYMVVDNDGSEKNSSGDNLEEKLSSGELTLGEIQHCVKDILSFILLAPVSKRPLRDLHEVKSFVSSVKQLPQNARIVHENEAFIPDDCTYLKVQKKAVYKINGTYLKKSDDLSQSVTNVVIDGIPVTAFDCRSTKGLEVSATVSSVELAEGFYKVSLYVAKGGISLKKISFVS